VSGLKQQFVQGQTELLDQLVSCFSLPFAFITIVHSIIQKTLTESREVVHKEVRRSYALWSNCSIILSLSAHKTTRGE
jgi:hypothetical protein